MGTNAVYNAVRGCWMDGAVPLVRTERFLETGYATKKCDQETGEDQKGA